MKNYAIYFVRLELTRCFESYLNLLTDLGCGLSPPHLPIFRPAATAYFESAMLREALTDKVPDLSPEPASHFQNSDTFDSSNLDH